MPEGGGGIRGQNALIKVAMKQYLGRLMILYALFKLAAKQCFRVLILTLYFDI